MNEAKWIWHRGESQWNETVDFQTSFTVTDPSLCEMKVSVNTFYSISINGIWCFNDQFNDFSFDKRYDELDLSSYVKKGENVLTLSVNWQGDASSTYTRFEPGAWFEIYEEGLEKNMLAASGEDTRVRINAHYLAPVEKITGQLSYSFRYQADAEENPWEKALVVERNYPLQPRPVKKLKVDPIYPSRILSTGYFKEAQGYELQQNQEWNPRIAQVMQRSYLTTGTPSSVLNLDGTCEYRIHPEEKQLDLHEAPGGQDGTMLLVDLGKEMAGYFEMDLDLPRDCPVLIGWGEHLEDLRVRTEVDARNFAALYLGKKGTNHFLYPFKRMGLRYLQLHVYAPEFSVRYAGIHPACYPVSKAILFTCADLLHNQIYRTCLRTLQTSMHTHYEDCPWREQALYTMDSRNQTLCGYYCFEEYEFASSSLRLLAEGLRSDHLLELCSPGEVPITIPAFTAIFLIELAEYVQYSKDTYFGRQMLPIACHLANSMLARRNEQGLVPNWEGEAYWNFYEWQEGLDGYGEKYTGPECPFNAFLSLGLIKLSSLCRTLGEMELYDDYKQSHLKLNEAMNQVFWVEEKGMYATREHRHFCELTQSLMICCDAAGEKEKILQEKLAGKVKTEESFYPITLSHSIFKYEALLKDPDTYGRMVFQQIGELFGDMLYRNATTFWETSDGARAFHNAGSLCHGWSAIPVWLYLRYAADSRQEGGKLSPLQTGIYETAVTEFRNPYRRILEDDWE